MSAQFCRRQIGKCEQRLIVVYFYHRYAIVRQMASWQTLFIARQNALACSSILLYTNSCPSVSVSNAETTALLCRKSFPPSRTAFVLVFLSHTAVTKSQGGPPGIKYTWYEYLRFSTEIAVYLGKNTK